MNKVSGFIIHCILNFADFWKLFPDYSNHLLNAYILLWICKNIRPRKLCFRNCHYIFKRSGIEFFKRHSRRNTTSRIVTKHYQVCKGNFSIRSKLNEYFAVFYKIIADAKGLTGSLITNQNPAACSITRIKLLFLGIHSLIRKNIHFYKGTWRNKNIKTGLTFFQTNLEFFAVVIYPDFGRILPYNIQRCSKPLLFKSFTDF